MLKGIILHWTAGNYKPCITDLEHYHFIIDGDGKIYNGKFTPRDNENCTDGKYAQHCGGGNTGRIGISICCRKSPNTPPTQKQVEAMCDKAAECCILYGIQIDNVITHAEFGKTHTHTSSHGKIDINDIPYANVKGVEECGKYLRNKIKWYYQERKKKLQ